MSGLRRLSRKRARKFPSGQDSEITFRLIALALLATLAIGLSLIAPERPSLEPVLRLGL
jgi:hypothetical protein